MPFIADDLGAWLIGVLADAASKKVITWAFGSDTERALRRAAAAAVREAAWTLCPGDGARAAAMARAISEVFRYPLIDISAWRSRTLLETVQAGIATQLSVLNERALTGTGQSPTEVLLTPAPAIADELTAALVHEILARGSGGGPLQPLADQLNHDVTHLQGERLENGLERLAAEVRTALVTHDAASRAGQETTYSLPPDITVFTGRETELQTIIRSATAVRAGSGLVIHAIGGMPGLGKTSLAIHAAHLVKEQFPDRQLYINLHAHTPGQEPVPAAAALASLLTVIGVDTRQLPADLAGLSSLWRDRMSGQRTLVVLDNAVSSAQVAPLLPGGGDSLVLITSRRHLGDLPGTTTAVSLDGLPPEQAHEMFIELAPRAAADPPAALAELVRLAGFLPLAISLLARMYARHPSWTMADLIRDTRENLLTMAAEKDSVSAAFEVSVHHLDDDKRDFFQYLGLLPGPEADCYAAAALTGTSLRQAAASLDALHAEGLLTEVGYRRYGMHDLIRHYARDLAATALAAHRSQALDRLLDYYQEAAAHADRWLARTSPPARPAMASVIALPDLSGVGRALAWIRTERTCLIASLNAVTAAGQHARVVALTAAVASLLRRDGPWPDAVARHAAAVRAAKLIADSTGEAAALFHLGDAQQLTGDSAAAVLALEDALAIYRRLHDLRGEANTLNMLGGARQLIDDYPGAVRVLQQALAAYRRLGDQLGGANALSNLGSVRRMTGDLDGALTALLEAMDIYAGLGDRLGQAIALNALGCTLLLTGDPAGAAAASLEALDIHSDIGERLGEAHALRNLGAAGRLSGDYPAAADYLRRALITYRELGVGSSGEVDALNETGALHCACGEFAQAAAYHQQALSLARELNCSSDEARAVAGLGRCRLAVGEQAAAVVNFQQALRIFQRIGAAEATDLASEIALLGLPLES